MSDAIEYCPQCTANVMCHMERKCVLESIAMNDRPTPETWRPIATAPKDKVEVLAWSKRHGVNVGILTPYKRPEMSSRKGRWFLPTHWMPLPALPNQNDQ